jgi:hypothetical protein
MKLVAAGVALVMALAPIASFAAPNIGTNTNGAVGSISAGGGASASIGGGASGSVGFDNSGAQVSVTNDHGRNSTQSVTEGSYNNFGEGTFSVGRGSGAVAITGGAAGGFGTF